jgi:hypothetical protein
MDNSKIDNNNVMRLEIAGLYTLSFLGFIIHMVLHNVLAHGMDRRILAILALVIMLLNGLHSIAHVVQGDILNGSTTFILQMVPGIMAVIWSFKYLKRFN